VQAFNAARPESKRLAVFPTTPPSGGKVGLDLAREAVGFATDGLGEISICHGGRRLRTVYCQQFLAAAR